MYQKQSKKDHQHEWTLPRSAANPVMANESIPRVPQPFSHMDSDRHGKSALNICVLISHGWLGIRMLQLFRCNRIATGATVYTHAIQWSY